MSTTAHVPVEQASLAQITANYLSVVDRVAAAAERVGRAPGEVIIVGAAKTIAAERIQAAVDAGLRHVGENYVQEAIRKHCLIGNAVAWHVIGHLQTNKVRRVVSFCSLIHSLDRLRLAEELSKLAVQDGKEIDCLVEVNLGGEETKSGAKPGTVLDLIVKVAGLEGICIRGLMCMPPFFPDNERVRPYFRKLQELAGEVTRKGLTGVSMDHLSMGMSHDFEVAIEEGARIVRIGSAIFGPRQK